MLGLIQNIAVLISLVVIYQAISRRWDNGSLKYRLLSGFLFGGVGVLCMMTPLRFAPGTIFDGRSIVLGIAGLFGGPVVASVAASMCGGYLIWLDGAGAWVGTGVIVEAGLLGSAYYFLRQHKASTMKPGFFWLFGLLVHVVMLLLMMALPGGKGSQVLRLIGLPVLLAYPIATMLVASLFADGEKRTKTENLLRRSEERYRNLVENTGNLVWETDESGRLTSINQRARDVLGYSPADMIGKPVLDFLHPAGLEGTRLRFREARNGFHTFVDNAPFGVMLLDRSGAWVYVNERFTELFGYTLNDIPDGRTWFRKAYPDPDYRHGVVTAWIGDLKGTEPGRKRPRVFTVTCKDGREKIVNFILVELATGETIITCEDMTARINAEQALRESEDAYRTLTEQSHDGVYVYQGMKLVFANRRVSEISGYSKEELLEMDYRELLHPDDRPAVVEIARRRELGQDAPQDYGARIVRKDGGTRYLDFSVSRISYRRGYAVLGTVRDITERKQAEDVLRASEERFRAIADYTYGWENWFGPDGKLIWINPGAVSFTGYSPEECAAMADFPMALVDEADREGIAACFREALQNSSGSNVEFRLHCKDGSLKWALVSWQPMYDSNGTNLGHRSSIRDITDRKLAEEEKRNLESQLLQAQKMEAIGALAGGIAHDFNNILTVLTGYGSLMQTRMRPEDPLRSHLDQILASAKKASQLTTGLLAFSRKQPSSMRPCELNETLKSAEKLLGRLLIEDIEFQVMLPDRVITILADPTQIDQILINLVTNARDAMPQGGRLSLELKEAGMDDEVVQGLGFGMPEHYALLSVSDTGHGMDESTREKIFEPFFTTKETGKGTGLGLSIVYGIVKQHKGHIAVNSEAGKGTTFRIYLPITSAEKNTSREKAAMPRGGTETILIAEDDATVRKLLREVLTRKGYAIIEAENGVDAVEKFRANRPAINLLISDVVMPQKSGWKAYEEITAEEPEVKVLFMSGHTGDIMLDRGISEGAFDFIRKPLSPMGLLSKVREILDR